MENIATASDMLVLIEAAYEGGTISVIIRRAIIRDMSDILNKIGTGNVEIGLSTLRPGIRSETYQRSYNKSGIISSESWVKEGDSSLNHRDYNDEPSHILYRDNGEVELNHWNQNGMPFRRGDKPTTVSYYRSGKESTLMWKEGHKMNRDGDRPAFVHYYENGNLEREVWIKNNKNHREDGKPAVISYYENGILAIKEWYVNGAPIRPGGKPTIEYYNREGNTNQTSTLSKGNG